MNCGTTCQTSKDALLSTSRDSGERVLCVATRIYLPRLFLQGLLAEIADTQLRLSVVYRRMRTVRIVIAKLITAFLTLAIGRVCTAMEVNRSFRQNSIPRKKH
jgi:hypothetical protein